LGEKLGCGAHLHGLIRLASGRFLLDEAMSLDQLAQGDWREFLHPLDDALQDFDAVVVDAEIEKRIRHGQQVDVSPSRGGGKHEGFCRPTPAPNQIATV
jgi:tRNA pseudouridine55 synthase